MKPRHDLHIHTTLSRCCSDPAQLLPNIIQRTRELGLTKIGIANHLWDSDVCICPNPWYRPQDFNNSYRVRTDLPAGDLGIKVLFGCETEFYTDTLALTPAHRKELDYALAPHSHIHMGAYVMPDSCVTDSQIGAFLCESFSKLVQRRMVNSIAHPLFPCGHEARLEGIIGSISDDRFAELCCLANDCDTALEINVGMFPGKLQNGADSEPMMRLFHIAKACGCKFTFGTDAHSLTALDSIALIDPITRACGITENDLAEIARD